MKGKSFSCVQLLATPWTAAYQAPLSMGLGILQAGILEWVGHAFLQRIFLTQGSNLPPLCLLRWQVDSLPLRHQGSPECDTYLEAIDYQASQWFLQWFPEPERIVEWVAISFSNA